MKKLFGMLGGGLLSLVLLGASAFAFYDVVWDYTNPMAGQTGSWTFTFTTDGTTRSPNSPVYIGATIVFPFYFEYAGSDFKNDVTITNQFGTFHPIDFTDDDGDNYIQIALCTNASQCLENEGLLSIQSGREYTITIDNMKNPLTGGMYPWMTSHPVYSGYFDADFEMSAGTSLVGQWEIPVILSPAIEIISGEPDNVLSFSGASNKTLGIEKTITISDLSIIGDGNPVLNINLYVEDGSLSFGSSDGLSFDGLSVGHNLQFSGALEDINNALATLLYTSSSATGTYRLEILINDNSGGVVWADNGHAYKVVAAGGSGINWANAKTVAENQTFGGVSGYLATITSLAEHNFILARINQNGWIGANDIAVEGQWRWQTGPEIGIQFWQGNGGGTTVGDMFANWATGSENSEPNNSDNNEDCAQIRFSTGVYGQWNDLNCATLIPNYVVEFGEDDVLPQLVHTSFDITVVDDTPYDRCFTNSGDINIPYSECVSLAYLYTETNGDNRDWNYGWFEDIDVTKWEVDNCDGFSELDMPFDNIFCGYSGSDRAWFEDEDAYYAIYLSGDAGDGKKHVYGLNLYANNLNGSIGSGLMGLPELAYINLDVNSSLSGVDFSNTINLVYLDIGDTDNVWNLDLSNNALLRYLEADSMGLSEGSLLLHQDAIENLIYLDLEDNGFETFDFSDYVNLEFLLLPDNNLADIDLSHNTKLRFIDVEENQITDFAPVENILLEYLRIDDNGLQSLDIHTNVLLSYLRAENNSLTGIDVTHNTGLYYIDLDDNNLSTLDLSTLNFGSHSHPGYEIQIDLSSNQLSELLLPVFNDYLINQLNIEYNRLCQIVSNTQTMLDVYAGAWRESQHADCPPYALQATGGNMLIDASWSEPFLLNGISICYLGTVEECLAEYRVSLYSGDDKINDTIIVNKETLAHQFTGLTNGQLYRVEVCAFYTDGEGTAESCVDTTATPMGSTPPSSGTGTVAPSTGGGGGGSSRPSGSSSSSSSSTVTQPTQPTDKDDVTPTDVVDTSVEPIVSDTKIVFTSDQLFNSSIPTDHCYPQRQIPTIVDSTVITTTQEFKQSLAFLYAYGMTKYTDVDSFDPYRSITRQEAAKIFSNFAVNVLCRTPNKELSVSYSDITRADSSLIPYMTTAYQLGLMKGGPDGTFRPFDYITKAEVNAVLVRMILNSYLSEDHTTWYTAYNEVSTTLGIITQGAGAASVSRNDASLMLFRAYKNQVFDLQTINNLESFVLENRGEFVK